MKILKGLGYCLALWGFAEARAMDKADYRVTSISPGCGAVNHYSPSLGQENGLSLVMEFPEFSVGTNGFLSATRRCDIRAEIQVPAGWSFRLHKAVADGEYYHSETGSAQISVGYTYFESGLGTGGGASYWAGDGQANPGNFIAIAQGGANWEYSDCKPFAQTIPMTGFFQMDVERGAGDSGDSDMALYNVEHIASPGGDHKAVWEWQWQRCPGPGGAAVPEGGKTYNLVSRHSGKCLDVKDHALYDGASLQQWECTGEPHQKFRLLPTGPQTYQLEAQESGKCLLIERGGQSNGGRAIQGPCNALPQQRVAFVPGSAGAYALRFDHSGKCLDIDGPSFDNGRYAQQWDCSASANQEWFLAPMD